MIWPWPPYQRVAKLAAMIIDLRDYIAKPGARDLMIERAEGLLLPEQERMGATILGAFRDADDPTRWVWLRAMPDLATRRRVLTEFYTDGALWRAHRDEVNAWIADNDDVLLLRPASDWAPPATGPSAVGMYTYLEPAALPPGRAGALRREVEAAVTAAGGRMLATLETDPAENNYPRHPIRSGEHGLVWLATFAGDPPHPRRGAGLAVPSAGARLAQRWLMPTVRSKLR